MRPTRSLIPAVTAVLSLATPGTAAAHAGPFTPVATSFDARITSLPAGVQARVVSGDQQLELRVAPPKTVVVLGLLGEPYLRFGASGVDVNEVSATSYLNRAQPQQVPAVALEGAPPRWHRVAGGHTYRWHEDRLHALAVSEVSPRVGYVGSWTIPLRISGRRESIRGGLWYTPPPTRLWFWPVVVALGCLAALLRLRNPRLDSLLLVALGLVALASIVVGHVESNLLEGLPVTQTGIGWVCFACGFAVATVVLLLRERWRPFAGLAIAVYAVTVGLTLLPTLRKGHVVIDFPASIDRLTAVTALTAGLGTLLVVVARPVPIQRRERSDSPS
jgi:hypothetical protein